jgi:hypothetical protein
MLDIESIISAMRKNEYIPIQLIEYTTGALKSDNNSRYKNALSENHNAVINRISDMIQISTKATNLSPEGIFKAAGFNKNDLDPTKLESMFGELRTVNHLYNEGFRDIAFIRTSKEKSADLSAKRENIKYVIEVTLSSSYAGKNKWRQDEIVNFCINKLKNEKKLDQLQTSLAKEPCDRMVFALVIDTEDKVALNCSEDYLNIARDVWKLCNIPYLHICIITGRIALGYGKDDIVFPPWVI